MNYMLLPTSPVLVLADRKGTRRHFKLSYAGVDNDAMLPHNVAFHTTFFFILMFLWQPFQVLDPGQIIAMCECLVCFKRNHGCDFCDRGPRHLGAWYFKLSHGLRAFIILPFIISPYTMSYHYHTQFLWISVFMLLYCEHIFFLAGFVSQKGSQLALEGCLEPSCYDSSSRLAREYPVLLAKEWFYIRTSSSQPHS